MIAAKWRLVFPTKAGETEVGSLNLRRPFQVFDDHARIAVNVGGKTKTVTGTISSEQTVAAPQRAARSIAITFQPTVACLKAIRFPEAIFRGDDFI